MRCFDRGILVKCRYVLLCVLHRCASAKVNPKLSDRELFAELSFDDLWLDARQPCLFPGSPTVQRTLPTNVRIRCNALRIIIRRRLSY